MSFGESDPRAGRGPTGRESRHGSRWWLKAIAATVLSFPLGLAVAGALVVPYINRMGELDRTTRFLAWLPGVVITAVVVGVLPALVMGLRGRTLLWPLGASLVIWVGGYLVAIPDSALVEPGWVWDIVSSASLLVAVLWVIARLSPLDTKPDTREPRQP
jgi:hypothetical protein